MIKSLYPGTFAATLENGIRVITEAIPTAKSVSLGVWIRAGSRDDLPCNAGMAHFIEHLLFKGTKKHDALAISRAIDSVGGFINGATTKEYTCYWIDVPADGLDFAVDLLIEMIKDPLFAAEEIERERKVVFEEIKGMNDDPQQVAFNLFSAGLWQERHPLSSPVLGSRETIAHIDRDAIVDFYQRLYSPDNMVIAACGALDHNRFIERVALLFNGIENNAIGHTRRPPQIRMDHNRHRRDTAQSHIYVALPGFAVGDQDRFALEALITVFGSGMSSRLFRIIREERAIAYDVGSLLNLYSDGGAVVTYAALSPQKVDETIEIILREIEQLSRDGISAQELHLVKTKLKGNFTLSLEAHSNRMARLGARACIGNEILSPEQVIDKLDNLTLADIGQVIDRVIGANQRTLLEKINLTVVGPP
ncbi:insulinase family protein [Candidatus Bipolaricaulota bacterium]|nr:insulinase family protein [Candidatus Bipolaricaulota bacterium]